MKGTEETYSEGGSPREEGTFGLGPERSQLCEKWAGECHRQEQDKPILELGKSLKWA